MKRTTRLPVSLSASALVVIACVAWSAGVGVKLTMDGKVLSNDVQIFQGRPYIPLNDVARLLGRTIEKENRAYSLSQSSAVRPRAGSSGKVATDLFAGQWRLNVSGIERATGYAPVFGSDKTAIVPKETGDDLAIVKCQLKNGTKAMQEVYFDKSSSGNTALIDDQNRGYVPLAYDTRNSNYSSAKMPPGTTLDFTILFSVPRDAVLTRMTFTVGSMEMDANRDFTISLAP